MGGVSARQDREGNLAKSERVQFPPRLTSNSFAIRKQRTWVETGPFVYKWQHANYGALYAAWIIPADRLRLFQNVGDEKLYPTFWNATGRL